MLVNGIQLIPAFVEEETGIESVDQNRAESIREYWQVSGLRKGKRRARIINADSCSSSKVISSRLLR